ncbi:MAG: hypothetical protein O7G87_22435 [bacterium]|nr:hypothetical protein [bacterium]
MHLRFAGIWGLILGLSIGSAQGAGVTGRFTTAFYSFERAYPDTISQGDIRAYQAARIRIMGAGHPQLSFQFYLRGSLDIRNQAHDPQLRFYHGFFRYQGKQAVATLGRQLILAGVGVGRMDGGRVDVKLGKWVEVDAFAGTLVPPERIGVNSWGEGHLFGVHLFSDYFFDTSMGASFYRRSRRGTPFVSRERAVAGLNALEIRPGEVEQQMVGFDLERRLGRFRVYGRWDLSTPGGVQTRRAEGSVRFHHQRWTLSGEYLYRTPYIDQNSIFSLFTQSSNREAALRGNYRHNRFLSLFGEFAAVYYEGEDGYRLNLGMNVLNGYVGYIRRRGYGGVADGVTSNLRYRLNPLVWIDGGFYWSKFRLTGAEGARSTVMTSTIGAHYRPGRHFSLGIQIQNLTQDLKLATQANPFPGNAHDLRVFVQASAWFFSGPGFQKGDGK